MENIVEKLNKLSDDELSIIEKGKNHWKNMDVINEYKSGRITTETLKHLIDLIVEDVWINAHEYYRERDYKKYDEGEIREIFNDVCGSSGYDEILDDWFNINRR